MLLYPVSLVPLLERPAPIHQWQTAEALAVRGVRRALSRSANFQVCLAFTSTMIYSQFCMIHHEYVTSKTLLYLVLSDITCEQLFLHSCFIFHFQNSFQIFSQITLGFDFFDSAFPDLNLIFGKNVLGNTASLLSQYDTAPTEIAYETDSSSYDRYHSYDR